MFRSLLRLYGFFAVGLLSLFVKPKLPRPRFLSNAHWRGYLINHFNKPGIKILEIGSRDVCGSPLRSFFNDADYIGFDYHPGDNVDIVGDAHNLSNYFSGQSFDLIFSTAVFEHLYAPWIVAEQISSLLKPGGHVFIETHFSHSSHERPSHFFQFSDMALRVLFNKSLGFQILDVGMDNPMIGFFSGRAIPSLKFMPVIELYCHSSIFCRKYCQSFDFDWKNLSLSDFDTNTIYPLPDKS